VYKAGRPENLLSLSLRGYGVGVVKATVFFFSECLQSRSEKCARKLVEKKKNA